MKIIDVLCVPGRSGFFTDDAAAIAAGALHDGFPYAAEPHTPGFSSEALQRRSEGHPGRG
jgi:methylaspartate ammonia-lyase